MEPQDEKKETKQLITKFSANDFSLNKQESGELNTSTTILYGSPGLSSLFIYTLSSYSPYNFIQKIVIDVKSSDKKNNGHMFGEQLDFEKKLSVPKNNDERYNYGLVLLNNKKFMQARDQLRLAANQGHDKAAYALGLMNYDGVGIPKNREEAFDLFKDAADKGNIFAKNNLGIIMFHSKKGTIEEIKKLFEDSAAAGLSQAKYNLAFLLGFNRKKNELRIKQLNYEAAMEGMIPAKIKASDIYRKLNDIPTSINLLFSAIDGGSKDALEKLKEYVDSNVEEAKVKFAELQVRKNKLLTEERNSVKVFNDGVKSLTKLAKKDNKYAKSILGDLHTEKKLIILKSDEKKMYLTESAKVGNVKAQKLLKLTKDEILSLLSEGAAEGNTRSKLALADMYENGTDLKKNYVIAEKLYKESKGLGYDIKTKLGISRVNNYVDKIIDQVGF